MLVFYDRKGELFFSDPYLVPYPTFVATFLFFWLLSRDLPSWDPRLELTDRFFLSFNF
jgi:hypothetical protein